MEAVAIILAVLGLVVLFLSWRKEEPLNEELTTTLKGIAYVKKEVEKLGEEIAPMQSTLRDLAERVDKQEQAALRQGESAEAPAWVKEARDVVETLTKLSKSRISEEGKEGGKETARKKDKDREREKEKPENEGQPVKKTAGKRTGKTVKPEPEPEPAPAMSNAYRSVLDLSGQGLDVKEIAARLGLSQDAVGMVLRTAAGGRSGMKISKDFLRGLGTGLVISALVVALLGPVLSSKAADSPQASETKDQVTSDAGPEKDAGTSGTTGTDQSADPAAPQSPSQTTANSEQTPAAPSAQTPATQPTEVEFYIPEGDTAQQISAILLEKGLIQDKDAFTQLILSRGGASNLARGNFKMPLGLTMDEIANRLLLK